MDTFSVEAPQNQYDMSTSVVQQKSGVVFALGTINFYEDREWTISDSGNDQQISGTHNSGPLSAWAVTVTSMTRYNSCTTYDQTCLEDVLSTGIFYRHDWLPPSCFLVDVPKNISDKSELLSYIENFLSERGFEVYAGENENNRFLK